MPFTTIMSYKTALSNNKEMERFGSQENEGSVLRQIQEIPQNKCPILHRRL